ncbi:MAG: hypothetical protein ACR2LH_06150 [Thermoleophilaceae bacterium]
MIVLVALTAGLVIWIVAWALGVKAFDAFLVTGLITLSAGAVQMAMPYVAKILKGEPGPPG